VFDEYNSGSHYIKKDVSHPMGRDKSKVVARKGKGKASSSSQSDSESFGFGGAWLRVYVGSLSNLQRHNCASSEINSKITPTIV
jgi:hypothetical protein